MGKTVVSDSRESGEAERARRRADIERGKHVTLWQEAWRRLIRNRLAVVGGIVVAALVLVSILADVVAPYDPTKLHYDYVLAPASSRFWLGTDPLGRDILSRLIHGARTSVSVGLFTQLVILSIGVPIGAIAAFAGGRVDNYLMRFTDIVYAFPDLLLVILLRAVFGGSIFMIFLAIGLAAWTDCARLVRGLLLSLKEREYVLAARAVGASSVRIILQHLLPNAVGPIIVLVAFRIPAAIFTEAALSYIGIGIKPPTASWGSMVQEGYTAIFSYPETVMYPALAIAMTMMAFTFLGDGLRDALDPRMK